MVDAHQARRIRALYCMPHVPRAVGGEAVIYDDDAPRGRGRPRIHAPGTRKVTVRFELSAALARVLRDHYGHRTVAGAIRAALAEAEERALAEVTRRK